MGRTFRVVVASAGAVPASFEVARGEPILGAARRAGIWLPFECGWGACGACKATLVEGEVELLFPQAPAVEPRDARRRRIVLCQTTPASDLVVRPLRVAGAPPPERPTADHRARLVDVAELGPAIRRFRFALGSVAAYRPGQYAVVELAPGLRRCYSMSGLPGSDSVEFIAKRYPSGAGSTRLFALPVGAQVTLELPYGDLWLRGGARPVVLVAGGTGISAVLAMLRGLAEAADGQDTADYKDPADRQDPAHRQDPAERPRPVHIVYGATSQADLVCWDELVRLTGRVPGARLHGCLIRPDPSWPGLRGTVAEAFGRDPAATAPTAGVPEAELAAAEVYVAGPPPMVAAVRSLLRGLGVPADRFHVDSFG